MTWAVQVVLLVLFCCAFLAVVVTMVVKFKTATRRQWRLLLLVSLFMLALVFAAIEGVERF